MFKFASKPSQPIRDHPLWPGPLRVVSNFVRHSCIHIYISTAINSGQDINLFLRVPVLFLICVFFDQCTGGCRIF